jgi:hypothetical protein
MHEVGHAIFEHLAGSSLDFSDAGDAQDSAEFRAQAFAQGSLVPKEVLFHSAQSHGIRWASLKRV